MRQFRSSQPLHNFLEFYHANWRAETPHGHQRPRRLMRRNSTFIGGCSRADINPYVQEWSLRMTGQTFHWLGFYWHGNVTCSILVRFYILCLLWTFVGNRSWSTGESGPHKRFSIEWNLALCPRWTYLQVFLLGLCSVRAPCHKSPSHASTRCCIWFTYCE